MLIIVLIMLSGIAVGFLLRNRNTKHLSSVTTVLIWLLLFLLGIEVGSNPRIVSGMQTLGVEALLLTIGGSIGTVVLSWLLWVYIYNKEEKK
ncbi:MAG: LysO family transporter [Prevotella sp.]|nr:LysO family transporter [Prevotella sp.]